MLEGNQPRPEHWVTCQPDSEENVRGQDENALTDGLGDGREYIPLNGMSTHMRNCTIGQTREI
jgi:hypothetical protein